MGTLGKRSLQSLTGVHPNLGKLIEKATPSKWKDKAIKRCNLIRVTPEEIAALRCSAYKLLLP